MPLPLIAKSFLIFCFFYFADVFNVEETGREINETLEKKNDVKGRFMKVLKKMHTSEQGQEINCTKL